MKRLQTARALFPRVDRSITLYVHGVITTSGEKCDVMLKCYAEQQQRDRTLEDARSLLRAIQRLPVTVRTYGNYKALA